jgi:hypothetical protein
MKQYTNRDWLYKMYVENDLSQKSIAKLCGINQSIISRSLSKFGIPTRKFCGRSGIHCHLYKGGRVKTTQGYIHILNKEHPRSNCRHYVPEQILVVEKHLGRFLSKKETIHHINEIKDDNQIENLYLFLSEKEHQRYHQNLRRENIQPITKSNLLSKND